jgi:LAO/AO transport system kinase
MVRDTVRTKCQVLSNPAVREIRADVERQVKAGELTPAGGPANFEGSLNLTER